MERKKYALIADGSSDRCLIPVIDFLLQKYFPNLIFEGETADFSFLRERPTTLSQKIERTIEFYEPDWIFIHRDAEKEDNPLQKRSDEIERAVGEVTSFGSKPYIKIIPIRMTEAWLLIDENAIRKAANNPNGTAEITLPGIRKLEDLADPKTLLFDLLKRASGLSGRKLDKLNLFKARYLVAEHVGDYSLLATLPSFQYLELQLKKYVSK